MSISDSELNSILKSVGIDSDMVRKEMQQQEDRIIRTQILEELRKSNAKKDSE
ncbi:hypothetical protein BKA01_001003 [Pseudonocardia eucalypti]|nr:hypothetical protein [Pseudonocardia eucalypti]